jgi:hypothetical protein
MSNHIWEALHICQIKFGRNIPFCQILFGRHSTLAEYIWEKYFLMSNPIWEAFPLCQIKFERNIHFCQILFRRHTHLPKILGKYPPFCQILFGRHSPFVKSNLGNIFLSVKSYLGDILHLQIYLVGISPPYQIKFRDATFSTNYIYETPFLCQIQFEALRNVF